MKHGGLARGLHGDAENQQFAEAFVRLADKRTAKRRIAAFAEVRLTRVSTWETKEPSPMVGPALAAYARAVEAIPDQEEGGKEHTCLDAAAIGREVERLLADPEVFLKRLHPEVAAKVRPLLPEEGPPRGD